MSNNRLSVPVSLQRKIFLLFFAVCLIYYCLIFLFFRGDCIIPSHDNLDSVNTWMEMFKHNDLFGFINVPSQNFLGLTTTNYAYISFSFQSLLFFLFDNFTAFSLNYIFAFFLAFIGMAFLLETLLRENRFINYIIALIYASLPVIPSYAIAAASMPYFFWAIHEFYFTEKLFDTRVLLLIFFPAFSILPGIGVFLMACWAMAGLICAIRKRQIPTTFIFGFIALCVGFFFVEIRLFHSVLSGIPTNRSIIDNSYASTSFIAGFLQHFLDAGYHMPFLQKFIILPTVLVSLIFLVLYEFGIAKKTATINTRERFYSLYDVKLLVILICCIVICSSIGALYDTHLLDNIIKNYIPFLAGFNWGRFWMLNRVFWYVAFALCLKQLSYFVKNKKQVGMGIAIILALIQMLFVAVYPTTYNYAVRTWYNELIRKPLALPARDSFISYDEFYSTDLFSQIKADIEYKDENVAAVGYHPAVLMFNGFHCIDGYLNSYELSYMQKFRTLIAPELEQNEDKRQYYDSWGGRMYLYNEGAPYAPTWDRVTDPITLRIDPVVMRQTFDLRYLLSRAPIGNQEELGISLLQSYHTDGLYDIYVYQVD